MATPLSIKAQLRAEGIALSGSVRAHRAKELDDALMAFWEAACEVHGGETAATLAFWLVSRDPKFEIPHWLRCCFGRHRLAVCASVPAGGWERDI